MESLYVGLILLSLSGVSFVAYRHPKFYKKEFSQKIYYSVFGVFFRSIFYDAGVTSARQELPPFLRNANVDDVQTALKVANVNSNIYFLDFAAILYAGFLAWLAKYMKKEYKKKTRN